MSDRCRVGAMSTYYGAMSTYYDAVRPDMISFQVEGTSRRVRVDCWGKVQTNVTWHEGTQVVRAHAAALIAAANYLDSTQSKYERVL